MQWEHLHTEQRATPAATHLDMDVDQGAVKSEALHIRSYDHRRAYDLDVEIATEAGETVFQNRYYLLPGHVDSEASIVPSDDYHVSVTLDNRRTVALDCRIDASPAHTAIIEIGNGAIALTEGYHG